MKDTMRMLIIGLCLGFTIGIEFALWVTKS